MVDEFEVFMVDLVFYIFFFVREEVVYYGYFMVIYYEFVGEMGIYEFRFFSYLYQDSA